MEKLILLFIATMLFASCEDVTPEPPTLNERLQGGWERKSGALKTRYLFSDNQADTYTTLGPQLVYENHYLCETRRDTLRMLDLVEGTRTVFVVSFLSDSAATLDGAGLKVILNRI